MPGGVVTEMTMVDVVITVTAGAVMVERKSDMLRGKWKLLMLLSDPVGCLGQFGKMVASRSRRRQLFAWKAVWQG